MNLPIAAIFLFCAGNAALPEATGPYRVGTTVRHFVDSRRTDPVDPKHKREIMAQYWFPTEQRQGATAAYLSDPRLLRALLAGPYYSQTPEVLNSWGGLRTHAFLDAGVSRRQKWPILLLEPGLGMPRANYTSYCEDLASHGYFVAAIDPPHGGLTVLPDGRVLDAGDDAANSDPSRQAAKTSEWAGDMSFVLNRLQAESARLSLDGSKVGALGHSMGGSAAFQTALGDKRVLAALDLDGSGGVIGLESGARVPLLMVKSNPNYSDADLAKLGRTRAQWEARGKMGPKMFPPLAVGAHSAPVYEFTIRDTGHLSFSDAPFLMPNTITRFSNHPLDARRTLLLTMHIARGFFDRYLLGTKWPPLQTLAAPWPEVRVERVY